VHDGELVLGEKLPGGHAEQLVAFAQDPAAQKQASVPPEPRDEKPAVQLQVDGMLADLPATLVLLPGQETQRLEVEL